MFGWFKSADERALEAILAGAEEDAKLGDVVCGDGVMRRRHGAILRDVVKGLRSQTRMGPLEIIRMIAGIISLIQQIGDAVQAIIDIIKGRRTPNG
jgi:hypothetical protein